MSQTTFNQNRTTQFFFCCPTHWVFNVVKLQQTSTNRSKTQHNPNLSNSTLGEVVLLKYASSVHFIYCRVGINFRINTGNIYFGMSQQLLNNIQRNVVSDQVNGV